MSRYSYLKLRASCIEARDFALEDLRAAVEYLKAQPPPKIPGYTGIVAIARTVQAGTAKLDAKPMVTLDEIAGLMPAEVWELFDQDVDRQREGLARRAAPP